MLERLVSESNYLSICTYCIRLRIGTVSGPSVSIAFPRYDFSSSGQSPNFIIHVEHRHITVTEGGDAFLSVRPSAGVSSGRWSFNGKIVVQWIAQTVSVGIAYISRAELFTSSGSLLLKSVNTADSGEYRVTLVPTSGSISSAVVSLQVLGQSPNFIIHVEHRHITVTEGGDALFSVRPKAWVSSGSWSFNGKIVVRWFAQTVSVDNAYSSRAELFTSSGSLLLKSVNSADSGEYRVTMVPTSGSISSAVVSLQVLGQSPNFIIHVEHRHITVTEGGDAFLSVRPSAGVSSGRWSFNGKIVVQWIAQTVSVGIAYISRAELFTSSGSLLLKSVNTADSGEYRVTLVPTSGSITSAVVSLQVLGQSPNFIIHVEHRHITVTEGGDALFSVRPKAWVSSGRWSFNGKIVVRWFAQTVSVDNAYSSRAELFTSSGSLLLKSVNSADSGEYRVTMVPTSGSISSAVVSLQVLE
ncbi:titin-like [Mobula hypostoma]|uniref:titin-like n=1 Tax=Mobula hypostoma TaxID=723540 RepID=UPI002FC340D4